jgi:hypothetical protein
LEESQHVLLQQGLTPPARRPNSPSATEKCYILLSRRHRKAAAWATSPQAPTEQEGVHESYRGR